MSKYPPKHHRIFNRYSLWLIVAIIPQTEIFRTFLFYSVMKTANPAAYQKMTDRVDGIFDMDIYVPRLRK